ncbi:MAG TPA: ABC transporter permease [Dehalococcoidia bacterium]|nr:ABC transporter permease [Dehalococcoidia bacterium]
MEAIARGFVEALGLLFRGDPGVREVVFLSLKVSGTALLFATLIGIPLGAWLGFARFPGRRLVIALIYTGMGFPPVVIGLLVYLFLSRSGPLGFLGWLFNPPAMVMAQTIIAFPLVAGFTMAAVIGVNLGLRQQLLSLGATSWQATLALLWEARVGVVVSLVAGFGAIISEVGAVMMVGGNIEGDTRVLTTAIVQLTRMGAFAAAMALGLILLALSFLVNLGLLRLQGRME